MRILCVGNFLSHFAGVHSVCEEISDGLEARGHRVIRTSSCRGRLARLLDMSWTIRQRRSDYDIAQVDLFGGAAFLWGEAAAKTLSRYGKPYVLTLHGGSLPQLARSKARRLRRVLEGAARVTAPSPYLARELAGLRGDIEVLPNGIDVARYTFRARDEPSPNIIWLRAFHAIYQPELAVRCLHELLPQQPEAKLTMIGVDKGDGSLAQVRSLVSELGAGERVEIEAAVAKEHVGRTLQRGDIFLNTSRIDNAPVTVVEAMACGLCVISTRAGGLGDLIRDGDTGLLASHDSSALRDAVQRALTENGLAGRLSRAARTTTEAYDWRELLPRWETLLAEATGAVA